VGGQAGRHAGGREGNWRRRKKRKGIRRLWTVPKSRRPGLSCYLRLTAYGKASSHLHIKTRLPRPRSREFSGASARPALAARSLRLGRPPRPSTASTAAAAVSGARRTRGAAEPAASTVGGAGRVIPPGRGTLHGASLAPSRARQRAEALGRVEEAAPRARAHFRARARGSPSRAGKRATARVRARESPRTGPPTPGHSRWRRPPGSPTPGHTRGRLPPGFTPSCWRSTLRRPSSAARPWTRTRSSRRRTAALCFAPPLRPPLVSSSPTTPPTHPLM
jgi:hypothetical protein